MNTTSQMKGGIQPGNKNKNLTVLVSNKEVENFIKCGNHTGKDNILFFDRNINDKVFLLLHGSSSGKVQYNGKLLSLEEVYRELSKENVFNLLVNANIKHINVLCCYGGYQSPYTEYGITIQPYFENKNVLLGQKVNDYKYQFKPVA